MKKQKKQPEQPKQTELVVLKPQQDNLPELPAEVEKQLDEGIDGFLKDLDIKAIFKSATKVVSKAMAGGKFNLNEVVKETTKDFAREKLKQKIELQNQEQQKQLGDGNNS